MGVVTSGEEVLDSESFLMILLHFLTMASFELVAGGEGGCVKLLVRRSVGSLRDSKMRLEHMAHFESTLTMVYLVRTAEKDLTMNEGEQERHGQDRKGCHETHEAFQSPGLGLPRRS